MRPMAPPWNIRASRREAARREAMVVSRIGGGENGFYGYCHGEVLCDFCLSKCFESLPELIQSSKLIAHHSSGIGLATWGMSTVNSGER